VCPRTTRGTGRIHRDLTRAHERPAGPTHAQQTQRPGRPTAHFTATTITATSPRQTAAPPPRHLECRIDKRVEPTTPPVQRSRLKRVAPGKPSSSGTANEFYAAVRSGRVKANFTATT